MSKKALTQTQWPWTVSQSNRSLKYVFCVNDVTLRRCNPHFYTVLPWPCKTFDQSNRTYPEKLKKGLTRRSTWKEGTTLLPPSTMELGPETVSLLGLSQSDSVEILPLCCAPDGCLPKSQWSLLLASAAACSGPTGVNDTDETGWMMTAGQPLTAVLTGGGTDGRGQQMGCASPTERRTGESAFTFHKLPAPIDLADPQKQMRNPVLKSFRCNSRKPGNKSALAAFHRQE